MRSLSLVTFAIVVVFLSAGPAAAVVRPDRATPSATFAAGTATQAPAESPTLTPTASAAPSTAVPDHEPPYLTGIYPEPGAAGVSRDPIISFHVRDRGTGVNLATLQFLVEGQRITSYEVTGDPSNYTVTYDPYNSFRYGQIVDIRVSVEDNASPPNALSYSDWRFITRLNTPSPTRTAVPPSGTPTSTRTPTPPAGSPTATPTLTNTPLPDAYPPYAREFDPVPGATGVDPNVVVHFELWDDITGIDPSWLQMTVNGTWATPQLSGTPQHYSAIYDHYQSFAPGSEVVFVIDAQDVANPVNMMDAEYYSFTIASATPRPTATPSPSPFPETGAPFVIYPNPAPGDTGVSPWEYITFYVCDDGNGVDAASIVVKIDGDPGYNYWAGSPACYSVEAYPYDWPYGSGQVVDFEISAQDISAPPNVMDTYSYSFTVATHSAPPATGTPTRTPTPQPTDSPTQAPPTAPPATPSPAPTPPPNTPPPSPSPPPAGSPTSVPTAEPPSPTPAAAPRVRLHMPLNYCCPGDVCWLTAFLDNPGPPVSQAPLVVLLDIGTGDYWFWPAWTQYPPNFDYLDVPLPQGATAVPVILPFAWPAVDGEVTGLAFYGALLDPSLTAIWGELGQFEFAYGPSR